MSFDYELPSELEFFERGFGLSNEHDPTEPIISYIYKYEANKALVVSFDPSYEGDTSITVKIIDNGIIIVSLTQDDVDDVAFQTWGTENVIRIYLSNSFNDFLIYYNPIARVIFQDD